MKRAAFVLAATSALVAPATAMSDALAALEARHGGRLGVYARDLGSGWAISHRADEAFPMCSTFKMLLVAAVLARVARGRERLTRKITYTTHDLLAYAPVTKAHLAANGTGALSVEALCGAAIEWSDNTAANLLLASAGGPPGVTAFARAIGDPRTRLDRTEPALNTSIPGDPRDTTTPRAMARDVEHLIFGSTLPPALRSRLRGWMLACKTASTRIPAGLPSGWQSGNKTGTGDNGSTNDVAFILPPSGGPIVAAVYSTGSRATGDQREAVLAAVGRIIARR
jgi:beta-lactamase class A